MQTTLRFPNEEVFRMSLRHLGEALHAVRLVTGLSQSQLAARIASLTGSPIDQGTISRIEAGKDRALDWFQLYGACQALNISSDALFEHAQQISRNLAEIEKGVIDDVRLMIDVATTAPSEVVQSPFQKKVDRAYRYLRRQILHDNQITNQVLEARQCAKDIRTTVPAVIGAFAKLHADGCVFLLAPNRCIVPEYAVPFLAEVACQRVEIEARAACDIIKFSPSVLTDAIQELRAIHHEMQRLASVLNDSRHGESTQFTTKADFSELDVRFHETLLGLAGHKKSSGQIGKMVTMVIIGTKTIGVDSRPKEVIAEHDTILAAIERRDVKSIVRALQSHMIGTARQFEKKVRETAPAEANRQKRRFRDYRRQVAARCESVLKRVMASAGNPTS